MKKSVGLYLDSGNLFINTENKYPRKKINYQKIYSKFITEPGNLPYQATVFGIQKTAREANSFRQRLHHIGYSCKYTTNTKIEKDWTLRSKLIGCWDSGITMEIMRDVLNNKVDLVVIGSNSKAFKYLIEYLRKVAKVEVIVLGARIPKYIQGLCDSVEIDQEFLL